MKQKINLVLAILTPLAAVPTAWAIWAGATMKPVFPMNPIAAGIGALAVIATSIAAGLLVTDIKAYNQGMKNKTEREELGMSTRPAWLVLGACVLAEISLSLLIVVIPGALAYGVLVFPLMSTAGVFSFATRFDLLQREQERAELRESRKKPANSEPKPAGKSAKSAAQQADPAPVVAQPAAEPAQPKFFCKEAGCPGNPKMLDGSFSSQSALNAHGRKHKPDKSLAANWIETSVVLEQK